MTCSRRLKSGVSDKTNKKIENKISNCPINEQTGDGIAVGRCWLFLKDGKICSRHGDVSKAIEYYKKTGKLLLENKFNCKQNSRSKKEDHTNKFTGIPKTHMFEYKTWLTLKILFYVFLFLFSLLTLFLMIIGTIVEIQKSRYLIAFMIVVGSWASILLFYAINKKHLNKKAFSKETYKNPKENGLATLGLISILFLVAFTVALYSLCFSGGFYADGQFISLVEVLK